MATLTWNGYLIAILAFVGIGTAFTCTRLFLTIRRMRTRLPKGSPWRYNPSEYAKSQRRTRRERSRKLWTEAVSGLSTIVFILAGGFAWLDHITGSLGFNRVLTGTAFFMLAIFIPRIGALPFYVSQKVADRNNRSEEEKKKDAERGCLGTLLANGFALGLVFAFLAVFMWGWERFGPGIWILWWVLGSAIWFIFAGGTGPLLAMFVHKAKRLKDGPLYDAIQAYAKTQDIDMTRLYVSESLGGAGKNKAMAAFAGIGDFRRIVLLQSAVQNYTVPELVSIVAHETGHYINRHVLQSWAVTSTFLGLKLFVLSQFINNAGLFEAVGIQHYSVGASVALFGYLYAPVTMFLGIFKMALSRQQERAADAYVVETYGHPADFASALQKVAEEHLIDLDPHPLHVWVEGEHPPVVKRIQRVLSLGYGDGERHYDGAAGEAG